MNKYDIHYLLKKHRIYQWEVAKELNIADYTLSRWLRIDLTPEQEKAIFHAINKLKDKKGLIWHELKNTISTMVYYTC